MRVDIGSSGPPSYGPGYRWWAYAAIFVGLCLTVAEMFEVGIALPRIADHFSAGLPTVQWITLGYLLSTSAMLMPMGRLADIIGQKRVYMAGFAVFIGGAALGGSSQTLLALISSRVVQGIGNAAIQANGMAMIVGAFSERERGKALGLYAAAIGGGSIIGPMAGGFLVSGLGWRSVFFTSVVFGLIALVAAASVIRGVRPVGRGSFGADFDWPGASLSSAALIAFLLGMTNAHRLGWESAPIVAAFAAAFALAGAFVWWESHTSNPMLELGFFRGRAFSATVSARFLSFLGNSAMFFLLPFYLVQAQDYPASKAGLILVPGSVCMAVFGGLSGLLSDRLGTRWPMILGAALSSAGMFTFSRLTLDSPLYYVVLGVVLSGAGMGMFTAPNSSAVMRSLGRRRYGVASALLNVTRTSANVTGVAVATTIVTLTMAHLGYAPNLGGVVGANAEGVKVAFVTGLTKAFLTAGSFVLAGMVLLALWGEAARAAAPAPRLADRAQSPPSISRRGGP